MCQRASEIDNTILKHIVCLFLAVNSHRTSDVLRKQTIWKFRAIISMVVHRHHVGRVGIERVLSFRKRESKETVEMRISETWNDPIAFHDPRQSNDRVCVNFQNIF
jgi:hypothetical protein